MDKFYFPMETMRITQNPYGSKSHHPHNTGDPKDYPIDSAGVDGGRSACFAPTDMKITNIKYCSTNTIWLVSTKKCDTSTFKDIVFMTVTHWNDNDPYVKKRKVGDIIKKGEIICLEGTDGAQGNHLHICCGRGYSDDWVKNSEGKFVMKGDNKPPEQVMYRYTKFTTAVMDNGGLNWKSTDKDTSNDFLPPKGYFGKGDSGEEVEKIDNFFMNKVKGDLFGDYTIAVVKEFQRQNGLEQDGNIGPITLAKMIENGFEI